MKFNSFWTIELEPGYSLFATHPVNRADLPFRLLTGIVDSDRFTDVGILFPAVWTDANFEGVLPARNADRAVLPDFARSAGTSIPAVLGGRSGALPDQPQAFLLSHPGSLSAAISRTTRALKPQASGAAEL